MNLPKQIAAWMRAMINGSCLRNRHATPMPNATRGRQPSPASHPPEAGEGTKYLVCRLWPECGCDPGVFDSDCTGLKDRYAHLGRGNIQTPLPFLTSRKATEMTDPEDKWPPGWWILPSAILGVAIWVALTLIIVGVFS